MSEKKHILFISAWYPDKKDPMPGLFVQRHALASKRYNEVAALFVAGYPDQDKTEELITEEPLRELRYYCRKSAGLFGKLAWIRMFFILHFRGFKKVSQIWGQKPDVVHVNILTREGVIALLWKWMYGVPYVVSEHWSRYSSGVYHGFLRKRLTRLVVRNASKIMPVSLFLKEAMENSGLRSAHYQVVPNVVDVSKFVPTQKTDRDIKQILHISCFDDLPKNITGIIDVIAKLREQRDDFKMVFVGDGIDFEALKRYALDKPCGNELFEFRGLLEGQDLVSEIQNSDFHLLFSRYETFAVVNLECLACGIPVISSAVGGIKEYINPKVGVLVPSEDEDTLLKDVNYMLDHVSDFDRKYIREYAVNNYSQKAIAQVLNQIYMDAIK